MVEQRAIESEPVVRAEEDQIERAREETPGDAEAVSADVLASPAPRRRIVKLGPAAKAARSR